MNTPIGIARYVGSMVFLMHRASPGVVAVGVSHFTNKKTGLGNFRPATSESSCVETHIASHCMQLDVLTTFP